MKNIKSLFVLGFFCFAAAFGFAHGKGDIEEIDVDNVNSWKENFDLEGKTQKKAAPTSRAAVPVPLQSAPEKLPWDQPWRLTMSESSAKVTRNSVTALQM